MTVLSKMAFAPTASEPLPIAGLLLGIFIIYRVGVVIYRLYFHPLAKFPGPKLYAASYVPFLYYDKYKGEFSKTTLALHEKYGPFVRITPNRLAVDSAISNPEVLARPASRPEFGKTTEFYGLSKRVGIATATKDDHRSQRRLLAHAFSESALREQEAIIRQYIDTFIAKINDHAVAGQPVNVVEWFNFMTFDVIGDMAFGDPFGSLQSGVYHPWIAMIFQGIQFNGLFQIMMRYKWLGLLMALSPRARHLTKGAKENIELSYEKTEKRIALGADAREDFMTHILRHNKDGSRMTHEDIHKNAELLILGGSETTATALSGLFFFLTRSENQRVRQTLLEEVRSAFSSPESITMVSTAPLSYLSACLEEVLRMFPPAAETPPRVSPGDYVAGQYIPKDTIVSTYQIAAHYSPKHFRNPEQFVPERWLPAAHPLHDSKYDSDTRAAFKPFSAGPRDCVGKNLAYAEMRVVVSLLMWHFDVEALPGQDDWIEKQRIFTVWEKGPLLMRFSPRKV